MVTTPYPLPESIRQTDVLVGDGSTVYGPFGDGWGIFDIDDVIVETRPIADTDFVLASVTIEKVSPADAYGVFTVEFEAALTAATAFRVTGRRLHERELGVTRGGAIDGNALEKELSKIAVVLQEQRRDIDAAPGIVAGDAASSALASAAAAAASAASSSASAAAFASAIAIWCGNASGTDALTVTHASFVGLVAWPDGMDLEFRIVAANTGAMTIAAGPLPARALVDVKGDAFVGGEFAIGDLVRGSYSSVNNTVRVMRQIVKAAREDKANIFTQKQTFNKPTIDPQTVIAYAGTITPNFSLSSLFKLTLAGNPTIAAPTGIVLDQKIYLELFNDGSANRIPVFDPVYEFPGGVPPLTSLSASGYTMLEGRVIALSPTRIAMWIEDSSDPSEIAGPSFIAEEQQASGTDGGNFTSGSFQKRLLNTVLRNRYSHFELNVSNQVVVPIGTYLAEGWGVASRCANHQLRLQNITDATTAILGFNCYSAAGGFYSMGPLAHFRGVFAITAPKTFELQHRCDTTRNTDGFGVAASWGTEVYSALHLTRLR